ncbi:TIGR00725 family protein [Salinirubellus salinus]|uniref:TIGR00725 family protein n=1 Tax=Salinirubellus salinus TaxID=1364945 RepID=A0A9E7UA39_9EURY|nr:TIGR00725 family protein [Salinirubellus salinus]UWM53823.1 TIGR00725 family protein [Salinirubellus salinus]
MRVSVIGGSTVDEATYETARDVGRLLAERGHTVVCGGYGGVMEAVCRGAREHDGETIGVLKGTDPAEGNEWITTPIATGMGDARNALVVLNGGACIAIDGAAGTLSELGMAFVYERRVAGLDTHDCSAFEGFRAVETPEAAVAYVERAVE